jgi:hypothetical protein
MSPKNFGRRNRPNVRANRQIVRQRPVDPIMTAQRFNVPSAHIPIHVNSPSVTRIVRLVFVLTSGAPSASVTYSAISNQDCLDYTGISGSRYSTMRVSQVRAWAESPANLSVSQVVYGLILTDINSGYSLRDKPTTGSRLAAIGMRFPFDIRSSISLCTSSTNILGLSCDSTIAASTDFTVTCDLTTEFYA